MSEENKIIEQPRKRKPLNTLFMLFFLLVIFSVATHFIPSGAFEREVIDGRSLVIPGTYAPSTGESIGIFDVFLAIPNGFVRGAALIFCTLVIGGAFEVIQQTGAINTGIATMIKKFGANHSDIVLYLLFIVFSSMGAFLGLTDGAIPFIPVAVSIAISVGYDPMVALGVTALAAYSGFIAGPTNPNSTAICQQIAGIPIYSGIGLRLIIWVITAGTTLIFVMRYAKKVRKDYSKSIVADVDLSGMKFDLATYETKPFTAVHKLVLLSLVAAMGIIVYGCAKFKWGYNEMTAVYAMLSIVVAFMGRLSTDDYIKAMVRGASSMVNFAFVISIAYGLSWVLNTAGVLDTIVYYASLPLVGLSKKVSIVAITGIITAINCLMTSASGKAAALMPIILPLGDIVGLEAQVTTLCYQFGDTVTNMLTPASTFCLTCIGFARVPWTKWIRFVAPLALIWFLLGIAVTFIAVEIGYC